MKKVILALSALAVLGLALTAAAETPARPRGIYIPVDPGMVDIAPDPPAAGTALTIYMNRNGGTFTCGFPEDSRTNKSSIACPGSISLDPFPHGDASWNAIMFCMRGLYGPYNVTVTDVDPGNVPHVESVVAGHPSDAGFPGNVGGVAPFTCGVISNAIVYTFAEVYAGNNTRGICETAGQETAHAFGFDHEYYCKDPMTYLGGCGAKAFQDFDAPCGEDTARDCRCGSPSSQNSHRLLLSLFGPRVSAPPVVSITTPTEGALVQAGFTVQVSGQDKFGIAQMQLFVDNNPVASVSGPPFNFPTPPDLADGAHVIRVLATNLSNLSAEASVNVTVGPPCVVSADCGGLNVCLDGNCVPGPGEVGGLGEACVNDSECFSGHCGTSGGTSACTDFCAADGTCPDGFGCVGAGGSDGVCWPGAGDGGGCCAIAGSRGNAERIPWLILGLTLLSFVAVRRRRAR